MVKFVVTALFFATLVCIQAQNSRPDTRTCEERCAATLCAPVQENCTRRGGAIKLPETRPGECACCEICVYNSRRRDLCGWLNGALYECGCNLRCRNGQCEPIKGSGKPKDSSSDSSCSD